MGFLKLIKRARPPKRIIATGRSMVNPSIPKHTPKLFPFIKGQRMHAGVDYFSMHDQRKLFDFGDGERSISA